MKVKLKVIFLLVILNVGFCYSQELRTTYENPWEITLTYDVGDPVTIDFNDSTLLSKLDTIIVGYKQPSKNKSEIWIDLLYYKKNLAEISCTDFCDIIKLKQYFNRKGIPEEDIKIGFEGFDSLTIFDSENSKCIISITAVQNAWGVR